MRDMKPSTGLFLAILFIFVSPSLSQEPCANRNGFIRDPSRCDTYLLCVSGTTATSVRCQPGLWFDEAAIRCRPEAEVQCDSDNGGGGDGGGGQGGTDTGVTDRCRRTLDMVIVMDGSNSVGQDDFELMIDTISDAVGALEFGANQARVGAVLYSFAVDQVIELKDDISDFRNELRQFVFPDQSTNTDRGIQRAVGMLTSASFRFDTPKTIMVITDGASDDQSATIRESIIAASRGIDMWAVGVGNLVNVAELEYIATDGADQTFLIESFAQFPNRLQNLTKLVCEESEILPIFAPTFPSVTLPIIFPGDTTPARTTTTSTSTSTSTTTTLRTTPSTTTTTTTRPTTTTSTTTTTIRTRPTTTIRTIPTTTTRARPTTTTTIRTRPTTTTTTRTRPTTTTTTRTRPTTTTTTRTRPTTTTRARPTISTGPTRFTRPTRPTVGPVTRSTSSPTRPTIGPNFTPAGICENSTRKGNMAYAPYPGSCEKVIQCYLNPNNNLTLAVTRTCPAGQFWSQNRLKCLDSWMVDCPYDSCSHDNNQDGQKHPVPGKCRWFYECRKGRSFAKSCYPGFTFSPGVGCTFSWKCKDECGKFWFSSDDGISVCDKIPDWNKPDSFLFSSKVFGAYPLQCMHGSFSVHKCRCFGAFDFFQAFFGGNNVPMVEVDKVPVPACPDNTMSPVIVPGFGIQMGVRTYRFSLNVTDPAIEVILESRPISRSRMSLKREGNRLVLHHKVGRRPNTSSQAVEVFIDPRPQHKDQEELEVTIEHNHDTLTLSVSQGMMQHVTSIYTSHMASTTCDVALSVKSDMSCYPLTKFVAYNRAVMDEHIWS